VIYLAFIIATGLYFLLGSGGPLHSDTWFKTLQRRVDATEPPFWLGFLLLVVVPCALVGLLWVFLSSLFGAAVTLLLGTALLFFAFGRADFPTLTQRFMARARAGDDVGAAMILEQAGGDTGADSREAFARLAARDFLYEGFQRWFPPVFYFVLLGPLWAVAYRLIQLSADDRRVPVGSLRHLVDWLPSRVLLLTLALVGDFERCRRLIGKRAMDPEVETDALLLEGLEAAFGEEGLDEPASAVQRVTQGLKRALVVWLIIISLLAML
jgi:AmpE protein